MVDIESPALQGLSIFINHVERYCYKICTSTLIEINVGNKDGW